MSLFEFLMVLVSIIIGLGIAEVLTGVARVIRARAQVRYYWVHGVLTSLTFVALVQQWWEAWGLRVVPSWSYVALGGLLIGPISLFLIAHLLFPRELEDADIEEYYFGAMRPVWILGIIAIVGSTSFRPLFTGDALFSPQNLTSFLGLVAFGILFAASARRTHAVLVPLVLIGLVYDVVRWTPEIGG